MDRTARTNSVPGAQSRARQNPSQQVESRKGIYLLASVLLLFILLLIVLLLPDFRVQHVEITGNKYLNVESILEVADISTGDHLLGRVSGGVANIFGFRYGHLESELMEQFPAIESVSVSARFPSGVQISISERMKIAYIRLPDGYVEIDKDGYVLSISDGIPDASVPFLHGMVVDSAVVGEKIRFAYPERFAACLMMLNSIIEADRENTSLEDYQMMPMITGIRYIDSENIYMTLRFPDTGKTFVVLVGNMQNIETKMNWLYHMVSLKSFEELADGVLDMTGKDYVFRSLKD